MPFRGHSDMGTQRPKIDTQNTNHETQNTHHYLNNWIDSIAQNHGQLIVINKGNLLPRFNETRPI